MGNWLTRLTRPELINPQTGEIQPFNSPEDAMAAAMPALDNNGVGVTVHPPDNVTTTAPATPGGAPGLVIQGGGPQLDAPQKSGLPFYLKPTVTQAQAQTPVDATGHPAAVSPGFSKLGVLMSILGGAARGASNAVASGALNAERGKSGFGSGFAGAVEMPTALAQQQQGLQRGNLENQQLQLQTQYYPQVLRQGFLKTSSEINKNTADASKATADAQTATYEQALKDAQTSAARFKEVGGLLYDVSGQHPALVQGSAAGQIVPADEDIARVAGVAVGTPIPVQTAQKLKEMATSGITTAQANGRSLLVDKTGKVIKDLGAATPVVVNNMNAGPWGGAGGGGGTGAPLAPALQRIIDGVGQYRTSLNDAMASAGRSGMARGNFMTALYSTYPNYDEKQYGNQASLLKDFTSGDAGKQLTSFNTAIEHANQLSTAVDALNNGNLTPFNQVANTIGAKLGNNATTNFNVVKNALAGEISKVFKGGGATDAEIAQVEAPFSAANSPEQLHGAINQALSLMTSKRDALRDQFYQGQNGQPNFGGQPAPNGAHGSQAMLPVGAIAKHQDGSTWKFKGGDQSNIKNWSQVKTQ